MMPEVFSCTGVTGTPFSTALLNTEDSEGHRDAREKRGLSEEHAGTYTTAVSKANISGIQLGFALWRRDMTLWSKIRRARDTSPDRGAFPKCHLVKGD